MEWEQINSEREASGFQVLQWKEQGFLMLYETFHTEFMMLGTNSKSHKTSIQENKYCLTHRKIAQHIKLYCSNVCENEH